MPFCEQTGLDFGEAANLFSPVPEKVNGRERPLDATIDLCGYVASYISLNKTYPQGPFGDSEQLRLPEPISSKLFNNSTRLHKHTHLLN